MKIPDHALKNSGKPRFLTSAMSTQLTFVALSITVSYVSGVIFRDRRFHG